MKTLMRIGLALTLALASTGCGGEERDETSDAGTVKKDGGAPIDAGVRDAGSCQRRCDNATCGQDDGCGGRCVGTCANAGETCNASTYTCGTASCLIDSDLGTLPTSTDDAYYQNDPETGTLGVIYGEVYLNDDAAFDMISVELYAGLGAFADGIATGTYPLTGDELNYETCGVCVLVYADTNDAWEPAGYYFATGGSVTVDSISGSFRATLNDVTFESVTLDESTFVTTPVGDGCTSSLTSVSLDGAMTELTEN